MSKESKNPQEEVYLTKEETAKIINQTTTVDVAGNVVLTVFKLCAGIFGHSTAMITDAIHSSADVLASFIAFIGMRLSKKGADKEHPYGHDRLECVASMILAAILIVTGAEIGLNCINSLTSGAYKANVTPGLIALIAAIVSIVTKEAMFWYTMHQAKRMHSSVYKADAWHQRSDAMSSVGALIGIQGARMGFPIMDVIAGLVICLVIIIVAINIMRGAIEKMLDTSAGEEFDNDLKEFIEEDSKSHGDVFKLDSLMTREFGEMVYVDVEITMDGSITLDESHVTSHGLHDRIEDKFPKIKHVMIHVNPHSHVKEEKRDFNV